MTTTTAPASALGLVGNLTEDPELRYSSAGKAWASLKLAVKPYVAGASVQPDPVFYSVVCFGSLAENVSEICHKGSRLVVTGRVEEDVWTGRDGMERTSLKVVADGIGKDLRFGESNKTTVPKTSRLADELLGPAPASSDLEQF